MNTDTSKALCALIRVTALWALVQTASANPTLTPGVWTNLTPVAAMNISTPMATSIAVSPANPSILYLGVQGFAPGGLWKSTDGGSNWFKVGKLGQTWCCADSLQQPKVRVDPKDPNHLYVVDGVRGGSNGFWISNDGGNTFTTTQGFLDVVATIGTFDMSSISADPSDFNHVLVTCHQPWKGMNNAGVLESTDGGTTWIAHQPVSSWATGSLGLAILSDPGHGIGNGRTWLVGNESDGFWRTSDAGANWSHVSTTTTPHGGATGCYSKSGVFYVGSTQHPMRSTDNGLTWTLLTTTPQAWYYTVGTDGNNLYSMPDYQNGVQNTYTYSPVSDGVSWSSFNGVKLTRGPFEMTTDTVNHILYSCNWDAGLWALKATGVATAADVNTQQQQARRFVTKNDPAIARCRFGLVINAKSCGACGGFYDVKGRNEGQDKARMLATQMHSF